MTEKTRAKLEKIKELIASGYKSEDALKKVGISKAHYYLSRKQLGGAVRVYTVNKSKAKKPVAPEPKVRESKVVIMVLNASQLKQVIENIL